MTRWLNRVALASGVVRLLEENITADHSRPTCVEGATTDGKIFRPYPALPFSRPLQSKIVFPVSHPNLAFLYQIDFFQLVLVPIMHEILATQR